MHSLRAAITGLGFVGRAHLEALRRQGLQVGGILGSSPERGEAARATLGLDRAYTSLDELARDNSVNVVHICTPNHIHFEEAKAVLLAYKHVMCAKPLAMDTKQSEAFAELAAKQNLAGCVPYNLRYYPLCQEAHAAVQRGLSCEQRVVPGSFLQDWLFYPTDWNWRLETHL